MNIFMKQLDLMLEASFEFEKIVIVSCYLPNSKTENPLRTKQSLLNKLQSKMLSKKVIREISQWVEEHILFMFKINDFFVPNACEIFTLPFCLVVIFDPYYNTRYLSVTQIKNPRIL